MHANILGRLAPLLLNVEINMSLELVGNYIPSYTSWI